MLRTITSRSIWKMIPLYNKEPPCHECKERSATCHGNCERYLSWKTKRDKVLQGIREQKLMEQRLREAEIKRRTRKCRTGHERFDIL